MNQLPVSGPDTVHVWIDRAAGDQPATARRLLVGAGAALLSRPVGEILVGRTARGRPWVRATGSGAELPVSVSHDADVVVVAARAAGPVGVDVERCRMLPAVALARRWFAPAEVHWLCGLPEAERTTGFLLLWTAKEAVGKAAGLGLRDGGLRRVMPVPDRAGAGLRPVPGAADTRVGHPPAGAGLVLAVAVLDATATTLVQVRMEMSGRTGHGAAARSAATDRTSLPVVVRGS